MLRRFTFPAAAVMVGTFVVLGCSEAPAPAEVDTPGPSLEVINTGFFDFNFTTFDQCNGEFVDFVTKRKHVCNTTFDAASGIHVGFHRAWTGTGVGQTTGTVYQLNWPWQQQFYARGPFPEIFSRRINNNLATRGSAENRIFSLTEHFTVNANGDVTVDVFDLTVTCVG